MLEIFIKDDCEYWETLIPYLLSIVGCLFKMTIICNKKMLDTPELLKVSPELWKEVEVGQAAAQAKEVSQWTKHTATSSSPTGD